MNTEENKQPAKNRAVRLLRRLSTIFLFLGIIGLLLPFLNNYLITRNSRFDLTSLSSREMQENLKSAYYFPMEKIEEIGYFNFWGELGKAKRDEIIGELHIPSVDIHLPLYHNSANANLLSGVGMLYPDRTMGEGNFAISGHRPNAKGALLHNLMDVEIGTTVYLTDKEKLYIYRVIDTAQMDTSAVYMLAEDQVEKYNDTPIITVMTCYNGKSDSRWFVVGKLVDTLDYDGAIVVKEWQAQP